MNFLQAMRSALAQALAADPKVLVLGQLVKYGLGGLTTGLAEDYPERVVTYPVCENLMNASAMGLALAGYRPIVIHERMDFLALGMDALVNHIPVWPARAAASDSHLALPVVIFAVVGKGKGQGPQHSKNLARWFKDFDGWHVMEPNTPEDAHDALLAAPFMDQPVIFVAHREFFGADHAVEIPEPEFVGLCGASAMHERNFYGRAG
jgi:pyruvate dehydrogenase E1 component beta subunit